MKNNRMRIISLILLFTMAFSLVVVPSVNADEFIIEEGYIDDEVYQENVIDEYGEADDSEYIEVEVIDVLEENNDLEDEDEALVDGNIPNEEENANEELTLSDDEIFAATVKNNNLEDVDEVLVEDNILDEEDTANEDLILSDDEIFAAAAKITTQPQNQSGAVGSTVTFSVVAETATSFKWQYSTDGTTWKNCSNNAFPGAATAEVTVSVLANRDGWKFRCMVDDEPSEAATLTIGNGSKITTQPQNQTGAVGSTVKYSVVAEGATSFKWQYSTDGTTWKNCSNTAFPGAATAEVTVSILANRDGWKFRCMVDDEPSEAATLTVTPANSITIASVVDKNNADTTSNIGPDGLLITFDINTAEENTKVRLLVSNDGSFNDEWYPMDKNTSEVNGVPTQYVFAPGLKLYLKAQLLDQNGNVLATQTTATEAEPRPFNEKSPYNQDGHVLDFNNKGVAFVQVSGPYPPYYVVEVSATGTYSLATSGSVQPSIHNAKGQKLEITNGSFVITDNDVGNLFIQAFDIGEFSLTAPGYYTDAYNALTYAVNGTAQTVSVTSFHAPKATTVYVPAEVTVNGQNYSVTEIGPEAFMDNKAITTANLPNSITVIGARAFKGCTSLSQMTTHD